MASSIPPPSPVHIHAAASEVGPRDGAVHETDVLKRKRFFSWKQFGGEGFLVSVAFHLLLLVGGIFWIVSKWVEPEKPKDISFEGSGGGKGGERAILNDRPIQTRVPPIIMKPQSRIVAKGTKPDVTVMSTPTSSVTSFAKGLSGGDISKGGGGGSDGGIGSGAGPGKGSGRHFMSAFAPFGRDDGVGLPGYFYDFKQTPKKEPTKYAGDGSASDFVDHVLRPFVRGFKPADIEGRYFRAEAPLYASQIFIPSGSADAAPKAFAVGKDVSAKRWAAWYSGKVKAPKSGRFRFWGLGDDALYVRWDMRPALDAGWAILSQGRGHNNFASFSEKPVLGVSATKQGKPSPPFRAGPWFEVVSGKNYPIDILISEVPGGAFGAWLLMEEAGPTGKGDGQLFLFRMTPNAVPESLRNDTGLEVDMTGKGLVWTASGDSARRPIR